MKTYWIGLILSLILMAISLVGSVGLAAQLELNASNPSYLPLIFKAPPSPVSQIAFISMDPNIWQNQFLYRINADGTGLKNLLPSSTRFITYSWSPNGYKIALSGEWEVNDEIYVMNADGSGLVNITNHPADDLRPTWSADGTHIAFTSTRDGSDQIFVMGADGTNVIQLTNLSARCDQPSWSPDGSRIAFNRYGTINNDEEIYVVNPDGSGILRLTNNAYFDQLVGWSPDGAKILFLSNRDLGGWDKQDLYSMNNDGTGVVRLTTSAYIQHAAWSPDGSKIAYTDFGEPNVLYVMNADGSNPNLVRCQGNEISAFNPAWSPDSTKLTYSISNGVVADQGIYSVNFDSSDCQHLDNKVDSYPQWRPLP